MKTQKRLKSGLHVLLWQEGKWYVVKCLEVEIASQGRTKKEALENIGEALGLYFEDENISPPPTLIDPQLLSLGTSYA